MTIEETIQKAFKAGYKPSWWPKEWNRITRKWERPLDPMYYDSCYVDPLFWRALGKGMGWDEKGEFSMWFERPNMGKTGCVAFIESWHYQWHRFIDHLAFDRDVEEFFKQF